MTSKRLGTLVAVVFAVWGLAGISWFTPVIGSHSTPVLGVGTAYATTGDPDMYDKPSTGDTSGGSSGSTGSTGSSDGNKTQDQTPTSPTRDATLSTTTFIVQTISDLTWLILLTVGGAR